MSARKAWHDMLCLLALVAVLWLVHLAARVLPTGLLALAWLMLAGLAAAGLLRASRARRRALLEVYLAPESSWQHRLRGGVLMAGRAWALGLVLALVLMVGLARIPDAWPWLALIGSIPLLVVMRMAWLRWLARDVNETLLPWVSWRLAALCTGLVLLAVLGLGALQRPQPDFGSVSLERAVWHLVDREHARSAPAETLLRAAAAKDGMRLWLGQQLMPAPAASLGQMLGWLLLLATETLFVWSYLLTAHGTLHWIGAHDRRQR